jgi:hypothetical protein
MGASLVGRVEGTLMPSDFDDVAGIPTYPPDESLDIRTTGG